MTTTKTPNSNRVPDTSRRNVSSSVKRSRSLSSGRVLCSSSCYPASTRHILTSQKKRVNGTEASEMLAAALRQMDTILAGEKMK